MTQAFEAGEHDWGVDSPALTMFDFDYQDGRDQLLRLYDKGTRRQWIGSRPHRLVTRGRSRQPARRRPTTSSPSSAPSGGTR